jgi:undecaprenyl diphosphate synthase
MEEKIPNHLGIILDGNGRWAKKRGLPRSKGHLEGSKNVSRIAEYVFNKGVKIFSLFAFSTENFNRSAEEVSYLMDLFVKYFTKELKKIKDNGIKIIFSGRRFNLSEKILKVMDKVTKETANNEKGILNFCFNYGGKSEIVDAVKKIVNDKVDIDSINEESIKNYLYQDLPDIDLLIRTSGEMRISNFMLYQLAYSELYFTNTLWPDFKGEDLDKAFIEYGKRDRRFGKA